ncbi:MAG TPA: LiaF domain-containing protein [Pseudidiomarina sp.]|nr:LiaF domain-containing protein [Pseudidiomarina sp.]
MAIDTSGVKLEDRPIAQVREEVIDQLIMNYSHNVISAEAFERRLDEATNSDDHHVLVKLVADLSLKPDNAYQEQRERSFTPNYDSSDASENERMIAILSSNEHSGQWMVPREMEVYVLLGSVDLDFTDAVFNHQRVTIRVKNLLGSVDVKVPEGVNVVSNMFNVIGSTTNTAPSMGGRQAPQIVIEGVSILGSLDIAIKKTIKEKLVAFANSFKEAFRAK